MTPASATVGATGFSSSIGTPASMQAHACSTCSVFGVATTTPSGRSAARSSASDACHGTACASAYAAASSDGSTTAASRASGSFRTAFACARPM